MAFLFTLNLLSLNRSKWALKNRLNLKPLPQLLFYPNNTNIHRDWFNRQNSSLFEKRIHLTFCGKGCKEINLG